jgi:hypothetical protein
VDVENGGYGFAGDGILSNMRPSLSGGGKEEDSIQEKVRRNYHRKTIKEEVAL